MAQRNRQRYSKKQAGIIEIESQKILDACKGDKIPSKHVSEWYHPPKYSYRSLTPNPDDDYLLSIFFWRPEKFYYHYVPIIPCIIGDCNWGPSVIIAIKEDEQEGITLICSS